MSAPAPCCTGHHAVALRMSLADLHCKGWNWLLCSEILLPPQAAPWCDWTGQEHSFLRDKSPVPEDGVRTPLGWCHPTPLLPSFPGGWTCCAVRGSPHLSRLAPHFLSQVFLLIKIMCVWSHVAACFSEQLTNRTCCKSSFQRSAPSHWHSPNSGSSGLTNPAPSPGPPCCRDSYVDCLPGEYINPKNSNLTGLHTAWWTLLLCRLNEGHAHGPGITAVPTEKNFFPIKMIWTSPPALLEYKRASVMACFCSFSESHLLSILSPVQTRWGIYF